MRTGGIFNIRVGQSVAGGAGDTWAIVYSIRAGADFIAHEDVRAVKELTVINSITAGNGGFFI